MEKPQFDQYLGGEVTLPRDVEIIKLATARASEICAMTHNLENPQSTKLIFQKLPVHMRRRVMSHNAKRMPRRLREAHIRQMKKSGAAAPSKRPSRKYRRRPGNLLLEYNRRQRGKIWLETHIWYAKRFHMIEKWGYKLANYSNDRGYRANYRAIAKHCMIQDISYYNCVQLTGPTDILIPTLKSHCANNSNELSFGAKAYFSGNREGYLTFYRKDKTTALGTVSFLWKPTVDFNEENKSIWIWVHPSFCRDFLDEIILSFEFTEILQPTVKCNVINKPVNITLQNKVYSNSNGCQMELLTFSLNRFRLRGPFAIAVLNDALHLPNIELQNDQKLSTILPTTSTEENNDGNVMEVVDDNNQSWETSWYQYKNHQEHFNAQTNFFEEFNNINSPHQLPRHSVVGLTVLDPRFFLPKTRQKSVSTFESSKYIDKLDSLVSHSPLWDSNVRNYVKNNVKAACEINKLRQKNLVPGVENDSDFKEDVMSKIPIILIQYPGKDSGGDKTIGFNSGIDIILPAGWAMPFWLSFVYRCARPCGLREYRSTLFESLNLNDPEINHPDTLAYKKTAEETKNELIGKYFRRPPNKRVNFVNFAISSPFFCEWKILINEWIDNNTHQDIDVYVLRDRITLSLLTSIFSILSSAKNTNKNLSQLDHDIQSLRNAHFNNMGTLVPVKIILQNRGRPSSFALICMPTDEDLKKITKGKKFDTPVQQSKLDVFKEERKSLRLNHKILLKRLMKKRKKERKENIKNSASLPKIKGNAVNSTIKLDYSDKVKKLWLPQCKEVRKSCDREVMGYIVQGDFSFTESKSIGWGYVVIQTLLNLIKKKTNYVLIRNTSTKQYRLACIEVINLYS